jgi:hypothetical protein
MGVKSLYLFLVGSSTQREYRNSFSLVASRSISWNRLLPRSVQIPELFGAVESFALSCFPAQERSL